jgi:hypothetical protein
MHPNKKTKIVKYIKLFSQDEPEFNYLNIRQGKIGDCWLIAVLFSMSLHDKGRKILKNLFYINIEKETYTIKIFDEKRTARYINVDPTFELDNNKLIYSCDDSNIISLFNKNPSNEYIWMIIIEKAFSIYFGSMGKLNGNTSNTAYTILCENTYEIIFSFGLNNRIIDILENLFKKQLISGTLETKTKLNKLESKRLNIIENHVYCIIKIENQKIYLHNPHNNPRNISNSNSNNYGYNLEDLKIITDFITYIKY